MKHLVRKSALALSPGLLMALTIQGCGTESSPSKSESQTPNQNVTITQPMEPHVNSGGDLDAPLPEVAPGAAVVRIPFDGSGNAVYEMAELRAVDASFDDARVVDAASAAEAWESGRAPGRVIVGAVDAVERELESDLSTESYHVDRGAYRGYGNNWNRNYRPTYYRGGFSFTYGTPGFYMSINPGYGYRYPRYGYYYYPRHGGYWGRHPYGNHGYYNRNWNHGRHPNRYGYNNGRYRH